MRVRPRSECCRVSTIGLFAVLATVVAGCGGCGGDAPATRSLPDQVAAAEEIADAAERANRLIALAQKYHKQRDSAGAAQTLNMAAKACSEVESPAPRSYAYIQLAGSWTDAGDRRSATKALDDSAKAAEKIKDEVEKAKAFARLSEGYHQVGNGTKAGIYVALAEASSKNIKDLSKKLGLVPLVAKAYQAMEDKSNADRLFGDTMEMATGIHDATRRSEALIELASARRAGGSAEDKAQAIGTLELAEKAASEIKLDSGQVRAMIDIARVYSAAGQNAKALALLDKALVIAKNIKDVSINAEMTKEVYAMKRDLS